MIELKLDSKENGVVDREKDKTVINHPQRYGGDTTYECIKVLKAWMSNEEFNGFCKGNVLKYLSRAGKKDDLIQEYKKAEWYLNELIKNNS